MKWTPKGCDVSNSKEKPNGPKFVRGPNLATWICLCRKIKRKRRTEPSDQAVEEKGSHWSWISAMQKIKTVKRSLLDQQPIGSLKKQHKDKTFLYLFSISVSKFFLVINFLLINVMCFNLFLFMVKNFKIKFLTAAEKQPIVLSLTAQWRNWFNCYFEFLSVADQFQRENLGQRICVENWSRSERSYNSHKGIYSKILEIQEP